MNDIISELDTLFKNGKLEKAEALLFTNLDELIDKATIDCDTGNFTGAIDKYDSIINLMQRYYGDSTDLRYYEESIMNIKRDLES